MLLVYFPKVGGCINYVVHNRTNHQFTSVVVAYFSATVCWIIQRTTFNVYFCLNHSWRYEHNQFEKRDEKP